MEQYAVSMTRSLEAFMTWAREEERFSDAKIRRKLCYLLYWFYMGRLWEMAADGGDEQVFLHCRKALAGEPQNVLCEMMMYQNTVHDNAEW